MTDIRYFRTANPSGKKFAITNSSSDTVASIDDTGDLFLLGTINQSQGGLTPETKSFIVTNSTNDVVSYITNTGYLFLQGIIGTGSVTTGVAPTNFEIRNSTNDIIAFINNTGSLQIFGNYYDTGISFFQNSSEIPVSKILKCIKFLIIMKVRDEMDKKMKNGELSIKGIYAEEK